MTAVEVTVPRRARAAEWSAVAALFGLTVRQHTHGRRMIVLGILYLLPCVLALVLRNLTKAPPAEGMEFVFVFTLLPHGLAPLTALLYAAGIVSDEVEEQTLTYLLVRSIPRWLIYVTKLLATWCVTTVLVSFAVFLLYAAIYAGSPEFGTTILPRALRAIVLAALAQVGYCALFGFLGLYTRWSLVAGIGYIVAIEGVLANVDFVGRSLTVVYYVRTLTLNWLDLPSGLERQCREVWRMQDPTLLPSPSTCVLTLLGFGLILSAVSALWFARSEYRVKTPGGD
jgi:ABC-2 type transport system permease protein